jgi:hypothetical protein
MSAPNNVLPILGLTLYSGGHAFRYAVWGVPEGRLLARNNESQPRPLFARSAQTGEVVS